MKRLFLLVGLLLPGACITHDAAMTSPPSTSSPSTSSADPYLWLEDVEGEKALSWVRAQNERTRAELATGPEFQRTYDQALSVLNSTSRVPALTWRGDYLYNLWRSPENPRGVYRRTTLAELRNTSPAWETVIDIDALSTAESQQWVFSSMSCLPPENRKCLVSLARGGGDAVEIREFDAVTKSFVRDGFFVPEAKSGVAWIDENTIFVDTDLGPGSLTTSGYPRVVKRWRRGTPLSSAITVFEAEPSSVGVNAQVLRTKGGDIELVTESKTTWTFNHHQLLDGKTHRLNLPESAVVNGGFQQRLLFTLTEDWTVDGRVLKSGSVVIADMARLRGGSGRIDVLMEPTSSEIIESVAEMDDSILIQTLENVRGRLYRLTPQGDGWNREAVRFSDNGALSVATRRDSTGEALVQFQSFTEPPTLYYVAAGSTQPTRVLGQEPTFDGSQFEVVQHWAVSADGTRIPYFLVAKKGLARDGRNPLHIFSYGGFRNALTPSYSGSYEQHYGAYGKLWLERGGIFVSANIRGGGEFGPEWHGSVLKENRHKVFEDFEAVAMDVVSRGYTSPEHLGIEGRSNGGLLTFGTMARRPELYGAVISGAPLSDMLRYHKLLAGASWMAEYGDPEIPAEHAYISAYSPYQNFRAGADYPPIFVYASTRDDRVHPGHARKSVAKLLAQGHEVWYYENIEGGHGGSSTNEQLAYRIALSYTHLWRHLGR